MYYLHAICNFLAYYTELCIIISNIRLDVTIGHTRKKDDDKKVKKMNEIKKYYSKKLYKMLKNHFLKFCVLEKEPVEQKNKI